MAQKVQTPDGIIIVGQECTKENLSDFELAIWKSKDILISRIPNASEYFSSIKLVETIEFSDKSRFTLGAYEPATQVIYITRVALESLESFCKVFLHELSHSKSNNSDGSLEFENDLSDMLGYVGSALISVLEPKVADLNGSSTIHNLDDDLYGYANCRCVYCQSTNFNFNEDLSYVKCNDCGHVYEGGYTELVELNRLAMKDNSDPYVEDALRLTMDNQSKSNHLLFEGIPINGPIDYFINQLEINKVIEPEGELPKLTRSMSSEPTPALLNGKVFGLKDRTILVFPNETTNMAGQVIVVLSPYDYTAFMTYYSMLTQSYGDATLEIPQPGFVWKLNTGDISLILDETQGVVLIYSDKMNKPD